LATSTTDLSSPTIQQNEKAQVLTKPTPRFRASTLLSVRH